MAWYDIFAKFYDVVLERVYREHRIQANTALNLTPGQTVVDIGCGTGASFAALVNSVGPNGRIIGIDTSAGMLRAAKKRVQRAGWTNIELVEIEPGVDKRVLAEIGEVDRVLCFLSLSVIKNWDEVLSDWFALLSSEGRMVIADVHHPRPNIYGRYVEFVSRGKLSRKSWEPLSELSSDFSLDWQPSSWVLGGRFFVAAGNRLLVDSKGHKE